VVANRTLRSSIPRLKWPFPATLSEDSSLTVTSAAEEQGVSFSNVRVTPPNIISTERA